MLKKFLNIKGQPPSTQGTSSKSGQRVAGVAEEEQQGFICPLCHTNLESADALQSHFRTHDLDTEQPDKGFICPMCMAALPSAEALQNHYEKTHDPANPMTTSANRDGDVLALRQELDDLRTSLKEEKWYSSELKKEVEKMQVQKKPGQSDSEKSNDEVESIKQQLKSSEESRSLLSSEVLLLRRQYTEQMELNSALKQEKEKMEQKAAQLATSIVSNKARADEADGQRAGLEESLTAYQQEITRKTELVKDLETQLAQRPSVDDVNVLKQELVQVQTLMDKLAQDKEVDVTNLKEENSQLQLTLKDAQKNVTELEAKLEAAPKMEDVKSLHASISANSEQLSAKLEEKNQEVLKLTENLTMIKADLEEVTSALRANEDESDELKSKLVKCQEHLNQRESELEESNRTCKHLQDELSKTQGQLQERENALTNLERSLGDSKQSAQSQLYEKDQQLTAIKLELDKTSNNLEIKESALADLTKQLRDVEILHHEERCSKDEMRVQLRDVSGQLEEELRRGQGRAQKIEEIEGILSQTKATVSRLEEERVDLIAKIEAGEGVETAIAQLNQEKEHMQTKISSLEQILSTKSAESEQKIDNLHQQLQQCKRDLDETEDTRVKLDALVSEKEEKLKDVEQKLMHLESEHKVKSELLLATEAAKTSQRADLENHLKMAENAVDEKTHEIGRLKQQFDELSGDLQGRREELAANELEMKEQRSRLNEVEQRCATLEAEVKEKSTAVDKLSRSKTECEQQLEEKGKQLTESTSRIHSLEATANSITAKLEESKAQYDKLEGDLHQRIEALSLTEKSKMALECQVKNYETVLCEREKSIEDFKKNIQQMQASHASEVNAVHTEMNQLKQEGEKAQSKFKEQVHHLTLERDNLLSEKATSLETLENLHRSLSEKELRFQTEKESLQTNFQQQIQEKDAELHQLNEEMQKQKDNLEEKCRVEALMSQRIGDLETQKYEWNEKVKNLEQDLASTVTKMQSQLDASLKKEKQLETILEEKENRQVEMQQKIEESTEKCNQLEKELVSTRATIDDLHGKLDEAKQQIEQYVEGEATLNSSLEQMAEVKKSLDGKLLMLDDDLSKMRTEKKSLEEEKLILEGKIIDLKRGEADYKGTIAGLHDEIEALKSDTEKVIQEKNKELASQNEAKHLLINQKLELQNLIKELQVESAKIRRDLEDSKQVASNVQAMLRDENSKLQIELTRGVEERGNMKNEYEDMKSKLQMQVTALNENLSTLRADLWGVQEQLSQRLNEIDELSGQKLELEAKLDNTNDERRVLLERCLASETECEKLREKNAEMRRKLDDSQAALLELGRENQTLQISSTRVQSRKWLEDSDVTNCLACDKAFSVTIRKHHCRNCGHIYCNECSSRSAPIASSKKPVRVCDHCFIEISQNRSNSIVLSTKS